VKAIARAMSTIVSSRAAVTIMLPVVALLAPAAFAVPAQATTIERVVSSGGIEAWLVHEPAVPLIAVDFAFTGGASQDPAGKAGTAYLATATMNDGVGDYDSKTFHAMLERKAIELNFSADRDTVRGSLRTLSENRDEAFEDLRLCLNAARFDASDVELNRAQLLSLLRRDSTSPGDIANRRWWETAFAGQPYSRPVNGTLESVPAITPEDAKAYAHRVLARDNLKIAVVGDIDAETLKVMLDRVFGKLPAKAELTPIANTMPQGLGRRIFVNLDVPQTVIEFGGTGLARNDPDFMAAYIVNHILGGGTFSSRLYQEVREKRGLAYGISSVLLWFDHTAVDIGATATRADRAGETLDLIDTEVRRLATDGPTAAELAKAKAYLNSSFALNLDTSGKIASLMVQLQRDNLGIDYIARRPAMIAGVTLDDTKRVAKRLLDNGMLVTVVGKPEGVASTTAPSGSGRLVPPTLNQTPAMHDDLR
jgi:zinc protease